MMHRFVTALVALFTVVTAPTAAQAVEQPFNQIVVIVDASGSYRDRQLEAIAKVGLLLDGIAQRRRRRWEAADRIVVISLDASPEVIWSGPANGLSTEARSAWEARFRGRSDYASCTDVASAFQIATRELNNAPPPSARWLFIFSDLRHEPPTNGVSSCQPPVTVPAHGMPWSELRNVQIAAFWMPVAQKVAWRQAFEANGISNARLMSESESGVNSIPIPDQVVRETTPEERANNRARLWGWLSAVISWALYLLMFCALLALAAVGVALKRRARRRDAARQRLNALRPQQPGRREGGTTNA